MATKRFKQVLALLIVCIVGLATVKPAAAESIQDLVSIGGAPDNQLVGYGLVVGLPHTGDQTTQIPYTEQSIRNMLRQMGLRLSDNAFMQPRDVASVMVTASVPPYIHAGQHVDVTVSALGNAKSLNGGVLLPTPLKGGNGAVYAQAQGAVLVSGFQASASGTSARVNTPTVGHIPGGGIMARTIAATVKKDHKTELLLNQPNFTTAANIENAINARFGKHAAHAVSPGVVVIPAYGPNDVHFMSTLLALQAAPGKQPPQVVIDAQSGTIVMGAGVELGPAVVSHGDLTVRIQTQNTISQPAPFSRGRTAGVRNSQVGVRQPNSHVVNLPHATSLGAVAQALNAIGATPADLIAIVQALKEAGALKAHVKVL
jgi:flagellar P-ring protein precursor FlgI